MQAGFVPRNHSVEWNSKCYPASTNWYKNKQISLDSWDSSSAEQNIYKIYCTCLQCLISIFESMKQEHFILASSDILCLQSLKVYNNINCGLSNWFWLMATLHIHRTIIDADSLNPLYFLNHFTWESREQESCFEERTLPLSEPGCYFYFNKMKDLSGYWVLENNGLQQL